ncbi:MAG: pyrroline-5-carboxylate reductase [Desulfuromonadales bacterium]|nr:pyrroline-5-carboxylate reductase [Desulfuromonadales bacterium]
MIGFIGGGNMAEALVKGLLAAGMPAGEILVAEPNAERRQLLEQRYQVVTVAANPAVVERCATLVLAIKPQLVAPVVTELRAGFDASRLLISILAGTTTQALETLLGGEPRVVRAMPNTPALVAAGATALSPGRYATDEDLAFARQLFAAVGTVVTVAEAQMDAVTGLSGSGPAYVYTVIEALAAGGVQEGLSAEVARELAVQTVLGAARMVSASGEHPAQLRDKVCSPGGTTIAGIGALEEHGLRAALMAAVSAATRRSRELGRD